MSKIFKNLICSSIIVLLICLIFSFSNKDLIDRNKEIKNSRVFINKLIENDLIDEVDEKYLKFEVTKNKDEFGKDFYFLDNDKINLKINKENKVVNFNIKDLTGEAKSISKEKAILLANEYIKALTDYDYKFSNFIEETEKNKFNYYSIKLKRYIDGYPFYNSDIILNINKKTGKLVGYINNGLEKNILSKEKNIEKKDCESKVIESFNSTWKEKGKVIETTLGYGEHKEDKEKIELSYIIKVKSLENSKIKREIIYFVSANDGKIINSFNSGVEEIKIE